MSFTRFAHWVILSTGWQRAAIAFIAGALSVLAMAPFNAWPVLFLTLPVAVWLIDGADASRLGGWPSSALSGWLFGFGYFLAGLYWIGNAFLVDADIFGWLLPFAVAGMPAGLAIFTAAGFLLARLLWTSDWSRVVALAVALTAAEWLRGHILSGFPWNTLGYALTNPLALAQTASLIGLWGLTFLSVIIFASPAVLIDRIPGSRPWLLPAFAATVLVAMAVYGTVRLASEPTRFVDRVKLRIMQPNLAQDVKFNYGARNEVMQKYLALSNRPAGPDAGPIGGANILIWPESAFPFFLTREAEAMAQIANLLPQDAILITGAVRAPENAPPGARVSRAYNSIYTIGHDGAILSIYDKLHLVPFGEYLPFQSTLEKLGFSQLTKVQGGFIPGTRRRPIELPNAPRVLPLICYEAIFPNDVSDRNERPGWIVNVTNDGWFGISPGPYQHLQQARLRAVEEGLPIVRAANTGVSAVIDPLGRIVARLDLGADGVLDSALPAASAPTPYSRAGDIPAALFVIAGLAVVIQRRTSGRSSSHRHNDA